MSKYLEEEQYMNYINKEKKLSKLDKILIKLESIEKLLLHDQKNLKNNLIQFEAKN